MKPRRILAPRDTAEVLDFAVQERALAVLSYQQGAEWCTFKARFLECDARGRFFVLDHQSLDDKPLPTLSVGQYIGVSVRQKSRKILFSTVVEAKGHFVLDDKTTVSAIRYRWPNSMTELQRRAYFRTPVPPDVTLTASLWAGGVQARTQAQAAPLQVYTGNAVDISCGGTLIGLHRSEPPAWADDELLGMELHLPDGRPPIQVDARFRGLRQDGGTIGVAIQFVGLELNLDGRLVLQRLAGTVQRLNHAIVGNPAGTPLRAPRPNEPRGRE